MKTKNILKRYVVRKYKPGTYGLYDRSTGSWFSNKDFFGSDIVLYWTNYHTALSICAEKNKDNESINSHTS